MVIYSAELEILIVHVDYTRCNTSVLAFHGCFKSFFFLRNGLILGKERLLAVFQRACFSFIKEDGWPNS